MASRLLVRGPDVKRAAHCVRVIRVLGLSAVLSCAGSVIAQSSFDTDPFSSRFKERANFDIKFKAPEKGALVRVELPPDETGRMSIVSENVGEAEAPPGKLVTVTYQNIVLKARKVRVDYTKKTVVAEGDVDFSQGASHMTGARLDLDLTDKVGVLTDGAVDLEGGIHIRASLLAKVGPRSFTMDRGTLTACEGEKPAWIFRFKSARVTLEEYARLKNVSFSLGGVPLLYTPYVIWPARRERASGLMIPGLGYNSNRGAYFGLSYYQVLGRSADATLSADLYSKGFFGFGTEVRLTPSVGTTAEATYYTIWDPVEKHWRWQTRGSVVANDIAPGLRGVVSWLDFSDVNFFQAFDRDFNLASTRSVKSSAFLTLNRDPLSYNLRLEREQTIYGDATVLTERRPVLEARLRPTPFFGQHAFLEVEAQAGELRAGQSGGTCIPNVDDPSAPCVPLSVKPAGLYDRIDFFPKLSIPLSSIPWLSVQTDLGGRLTSYGKSLSTDGQSLDDSRYTRRYFHAHIEATGPSFSRVFESGFGPFLKLKHVIEPRFDYDYLPAPEDLSRTPLFDEVDTIFGVHTLRYALVQRLLGKEKAGNSREIASLEISRVYSFKLPGEGTPLGVNPLLSKNSPIDATLRVNTGPNFNFDARSTYDSQASQITSASITANVTTPSRSLSLSLFDNRPVGAESSAQLRFGGGTVLVPKLLRLDFQGNYDLSLGKMLESRTLLTIEGSCFKILTEYRDLRIGAVPSRDFRIALNLKNIGSFLDFTGSLP
jgi:LPS-assembly protein